MEKVTCPNCHSKDVEFKCHHNNRRKKIPIDVYFCKQCRKRFNIELDKKFYNHSGNWRTRKNLCWHCSEKLDNDTERKIGTHIDCIVKGFLEYGYGLTDDFQLYFECICDFDNYSKLLSDRK